MSCTNPLYALKLPLINPETGKNKIKILPRRVDSEDYFTLIEKHGADSVLCLPCGHCPSCIEERSRTWALRCVLEASQYVNNCFVTLTYNDKCLPKGLCKKDLQNFIKRLRYKFPGVRYYAVGEYGSKTKRPHYHLILFGVFPPDAKFECAARFDGSFYSSKILQSLWPFGFVSVGECSFASCAYVARYCQKKLGSKTGEFSLMSLKPGIGASYFEKNKDLIYEYDRIYGDFGSIKDVKPGRYFDKLLSKIDPEAFEALKLKRITLANQYQINNLIKSGFTYYEELLKYKENLKAIKLERLKRGGI